MASPPLPPIAAIFNHKGGVAKTTLTFHLGWRLAQTLKVLMIDLDSQCNLTGMCVDPGSQFLEERADAQGTKLSPIPDPLEAFFDLAHPAKTGQMNIRAAIAPLLPECEGVAASYGLRQGYLHVSPQVFQVARRDELFLPKEWIDFRKGLPPAEREFERPPESLYLLGGSIQLDEIADYVHDEYRPNGKPGSFITGLLPGLLRLIQDAEQRAGRPAFDLVLLDLSPSTNALNQLMVMSSNFLIVPCTLDYQSSVAVKLLHRLLPRWADHHIKKTEESTLLVGNPFSPVLKTPIVLGYTVARGRYDSEGNLTKACKAYKKILSNRFDELMKDRDMRRRGLVFLVDHLHLLGEFPDWRSAGLIAGMKHVPVPNTSADGSTCIFAEKVHNAVEWLLTVVPDVQYPLLKKTLAVATIYRTLYRLERVRIPIVGSLAHMSCEDMVRKYFALQRAFKLPDVNDAPIVDPPPQPSPQPSADAAHIPSVGIPQPSAGIVGVKRPREQ
jgi:cellulose biosynthesis protein BcsQ